MQYEEPNMQILIFETSDVVTTSDLTPGDDFKPTPWPGISTMRF